MGERLCNATTRQRDGALPCVWSYRDSSLEKYWHFPVTLSKSGPDNSKRTPRYTRLAALLADGAAGGSTAVLAVRTWQSMGQKIIAIAQPRGKTRQEFWHRAKHRAGSKSCTAPGRFFTAIALAPKPLASLCPVSPSPRAQSRLQKMFSQLALHL